MAMQKFELIKKDKLTHDVYHMIFKIDNKLNILPGQFITFILPKLGARAYSILVENQENIELIIKRVEKGRGGSIYICGLEIGEILNGVGPVGKFLIQENNNNKMFIGTGTGLVPLYNQILHSLKINPTSNIKLIFGVRFKKDLFYTDMLNKLKEKYKNFDFEVYLSRENSYKYNTGYVTNYLNNSSLLNYKEFYICGMPDMVDSVNEKLSKEGVGDKFIFSEKY